MIARGYGGDSRVVAAAESPRGPLLLRWTPRGDLELRVNGVFAMDTRETSSEQALADLALGACDRPARVLVGGLGLGYTLRRVLADVRVTAVTVVELEPALVSWLQADLVPGAAAGLSDARVTVHVGDVRDHVGQTAPGSVDVVVLDVDNGPDFLVHAGNETLYEPAFVRRCADALTPGGVLAVWSMAASPQLMGALGAVFNTVRTHACPVRLQGRHETYCVLVATGRG